MVKGRPRLNREKRDYGTPELQKKINTHYPLKNLYENKEISQRAYQAVLTYSYIRYRAHLSMQIKSSPNTVCLIPLQQRNCLAHKPCRYFETTFKLISTYLGFYPKLAKCLRYLLGESKKCPQENIAEILLYFEDFLEEAITPLGKGS